jgi:DNA repair protein RecO (recombination protein O)
VPLYRDEGVVLRTWKLGESDRIVVIFTRGRGKVRAVAKGVRKTRSKFGARLEPTSHVALQLYEGRELDIVTQAESLDHLGALRDDLDRLTRATAMLEAVDTIAQDRSPDSRLYTMLVGALRTLAAADHPLVVPGFFLKLLAHEGLQPRVDACAVCSDESVDLVAFDLDEGGLLCREHRKGAAITPAAVELLQLVADGRLRVALDRPAGAAALEVEGLATRTLEHHLERRLRSVQMLPHTGT